MKQVADGVFLLDAPHVFNVYLAGDVLIDAGAPFDEGRILSQLKGHAVTSHALTHAHPDHMGASRAVCTKLGLPFEVGLHDADIAEDPGLLSKHLLRLPLLGLPLPRTPISDAALRIASGGGHAVDRRLREGDTVGDFRVVNLPGHSPGQIGFWRAADRVLICGDALWNFPTLMPPPGFINADSKLMRASIRKLLALDPAVVLFGHGEPLHDIGRLEQLVDGLED